MLLLKQFTREINMIIIDNYSEWKYIVNTLNLNEIYIDGNYKNLIGFIVSEKHRIEIVGYYLSYRDKESAVKVFSILSLDRSSSEREEKLFTKMITEARKLSSTTFKNIDGLNLKQVKVEAIVNYWQTSIRVINNINDLKKYYELDKKYYSVKIPDFEWYKNAWNIKNNSFWGFFVGNELKGGFDLFQVNEHEYIRLLSSGNESILNIDNVESNSIYWYISGIVLSQDWRGSIFADLMMDKIKEIIKYDATPLKKVGALIASNEGQKLMSRHGFVCSAQLTI